MLRSQPKFQPILLALVATMIACSAQAMAGAIEGHYLEARTCQVYTGPCFANSEVGLTGKDAVMAWKIQQGELNGVELSGLSVAVVVRASDTLGFHGLADAASIRSLILVDERASAEQRAALLQLVRSQASAATRDIARVQTAPMEMQLDEVELTGQFKAGDLIHLAARKARPGDCICSNESAYYPPLTQLEGSAPGVTIDGHVTARALGTRWWIPDSRTAYLGTFSVALPDATATSGR
jgi:hypothetical protein